MSSSGLVAVLILVLAIGNCAGASLSILGSSRRVCTIRDFGVTGTGVSYDTLGIQAAIDFCASHQGGGVVHIPPGQYLTGTLHLRSNITLWVEEGAVLLGSTRQQDFEPGRWYTILAEGAENVEVTGGGVVTGQGSEFVVEFKEEKNIMVSWNETGDCFGDECRPRLVGFIGCKNVRVRNVFLRDPAYWWYVPFSPYLPTRYTRVVD